MNAHDLAVLLTGAEYPLSITPSIRNHAKASGLVIVYGAGDDLIVFDGAIDDEYGAGDRTEIRLDRKGVIPDYDQISKRDRDPDVKDNLRDYFQRECGGGIVTAVWAAEPYSWTYETTIPHETFEIVEDGQPYCRGIVFALSDVPLSFAKA